jgi:hypothetical protein
MDGTYADLLGSTISPSSFQLDNHTNIKKDAENFQIMKDYYDSCVDIEINSDEVLAQFFEDIYNIKLEAELLEQQNKTFQITSEIMEIISYPNLADGIVIDAGGLFSIEILPDDEDKTKMAFMIYPPSEFAHVSIAPFKEQGSEKLYELVSSVFSTANGTERDRDRLTSLLDIGLHALSDDRMYFMVDDAISVQNKLFQLSKSV